QPVRVGIGVGVWVPGKVGIGVAGSAVGGTGTTVGTTEGAGGYGAPLRQNVPPGAGRQSG
ncbi:hypothetical protein JYK22_28670, partial [Nonomuraea sp. RK-328]|nr:hypothetical protein [Nonomuraea sp. RK-328]